MSSSEPTTSFSSSGVDAISHIIEVVPDTSTDVLTPQEFDEFYEIERTVKEIVTGDYQRIALQFPDELLHISVPIYRRLKRRISDSVSEPNPGTTRELYVLADTSYGSCCVDEVAAQHVNADLVVHYGHACMTRTSRLPVVYVFGRKDIDVEGCTAELINAFEQGDLGRKSGGEHEKKAVLLKHDVAFTHVADLLLQKLNETLSKSSPSISVLYHEIPITTYPSSTIVPAEPEDPPPENDAESYTALEHTTIFYVGGESLGLTNLLMTNASSDVFTYDPSTRKAFHESSSGRTNKLLMRRYVAVQKARDADVFGILVGTLGVASYLPLIAHIRRLLARRQKKSYTISVGKLNPAKLANFLEIECFVLVACPENSLVEDKEFLRPIVTPYELEVAMQAEQTWTGQYVLDFEKLLAHAKAVASGEEPDTSKDNMEEGVDESDSDQPVFSLVTGKYRHAKRYGDKADAVSEQHPADGVTAIILRNQDGQVAKMDSAAGQFLQDRTYQGLEMRLGQDAPSVLEQGRAGIARGYQDDRAHKSAVSAAAEGPTC